MRLQTVDIENYRSIRNCKFDLDPACRVLVGMNEVGKTNLLKALSLLSANEKTSTGDVRQSLPEEPEITRSWVDFTFSFSNEEAADLCEQANKKIYCGSKERPILAFGKSTLTPRKFFLNESRRAIYRVNVLTNNKFGATWMLDDDVTISGDWRKPAKTTPDVKIPGTDISIKTIDAIWLNDYSSFPEGALQTLTPADVKKIINDVVVKHLMDNLPEVIHWKYQENNLLPSEISMQEFIDDQDTCIPLKHMFEMAGIEDVEKTLTAAKENIHRLRNLLDRVALRATKHLHAVWDEARNVEIDLAPHGENIIASIKDKHNHFDFSVRSDGFKRFITFLLIISARVKTEDLENALILIDEPEIGLHPSGARFLMNELIKISKSNSIVYSTHSIFMIDRELIDRHYIVSKKKETTTIASAVESNICDEEVIYKALGHSIFDSLKLKNIVFEGWRDKKLFKLALRASNANPHSIRFPDIGACHAQGVTDIRRISQTLELANKECFILSDADEPAKRELKEFRDNRGYGSWIMYSDLIEGIFLTGEDFLSTEAFTPILEEIRSEYPSLLPVDKIDFANPKGKIHALKKWISPLKIDGDVIIRRIKNMVFADLTVEQIRPEYYDLLGKLADLMKLPKIARSRRTVVAS